MHDHAVRAGGPVRDSQASHLCSRWLTWDTARSGCVTSWHRHSCLCLSPQAKMERLETLAICKSKGRIPNLLRPAPAGRECQSHAGLPTAEALNMRGAKRCHLRPTSKGNSNYRTPELFALGVYCSSPTRSRPNPSIATRKTWRGGWLFAQAPIAGAPAGCALRSFDICDGVHAASRKILGRKVPTLALLGAGAQVRGGRFRNVRTPRGRQALPRPSLGTAIGGLVASNSC
jgi:hypothetical protein